MAETRRKKRRKKVVAKKVTKKKVTKAARKKKKKPGGTTMERAAQMSEMRAEGHTFEAIAAEFGVTRQRVHQLVSGASEEAPKADKKQGNHSPNPELLRGRGVQEKIKQYDAASRDASEVRIGDRLVYMRMKRGLTIGQLSQESEVPYGVLSTYENNKAQPSCDSLRKLCTALEISAHWLLFGEMEADTQSLQAEVKKWKQRAIRLRKELASQAD